MQLTESSLKKIVIIGSIFGIIFLYMYSGTVRLDPIRSLEGIAKDSEVNLQGEVISVSQTDTVAFVEVANEAVVVTDVVVFKDRDIWLHAGDYIEVVGTTEEYQGEMEIIASEMIVYGR